MIRKNILANFVGKLWIAVVSVAFLPLYIQFLGIEAYGLLGVMLSLQSLLALLDLGLSYTATREFARCRGAEQEALSTVLRTFEVCYWAVAILIGLGVALAAPYVADWINYRSLDAEYAERALRLFALVLCTQWPGALYAGGLLGLERQVSLNVIQAVSATARHGGAALVLWQVSPTLEALLLWQAGINLCGTLVLATTLRRLMPQPQRRPHFSVAVLRKTARYSLGVSTTLALLTVLSQMDKVWLARIVTLDQFGYYALATSVAAALGYLGYPVLGAVYPQLVHADEQSAMEATRQLYHRATQMLAVLVLPAAAVLICFAPEVLLLWTRNQDVVLHTTLVLQLLVLASAINQMTSMSYSLQAAVGWTRLSVQVQAVSVGVMLVMLLVVVPKWSTTGAAACWVALYLGQMLVGPALMHRRILRGEYRHWLFRDILLPAGAAAAVALTGRALLPESSSTVVLAGIIAATYAMAVAAQLWVSPLLQESLKPIVRKLARRG